MADSPETQIPYAELGYSRNYIKRHPEGREYVRRVCEGGCHKGFDFEVDKGWKRFSYCQWCKRVTSWRIAL